MPVSASVLACSAAICAAMAICGVTCVPEASSAATFRAGLEAAAGAFSQSNGAAAAAVATGEENQKMKLMFTG